MVGVGRYTAQRATRRVRVVTVGMGWGGGEGGGCAIFRNIICCFDTMGEAEIRALVCYSKTDLVRVLLLCARGGVCE